MAKAEMSISLDYQAKQAISQLTKALEQINKTIAKKGEGTVNVYVASEEETHDDETLFKVYRVLQEQGFTTQSATMLVGALQNEGILFRERRSS